MIKNKCHIKKDDKVKVIAGKDKGKVGKVLSLKKKNSRIIIENKLYIFDDINAKKLLPFFNKQCIHIPKSFEKKWFETF